MGWIQTNDFRRGAVAGVVAAVAFLLAMALDLALTRERTNDVQLLGRITPGGRRAWPVIGTVMHLINGAALGVLFAWLHHGLPGSTWVRGVIFAQVENLFLWPVMIVLDRTHPSIRAGDMDRYNRPVPFLQEVFRHAVYGAVLGAVFERLEPRG